jgi:hypothetical protein
MSPKIPNNFFAGGPKIKLPVSPNPYCRYSILGGHTTPQPQNSDVQWVGIGRYSDAPSVGIDLCRHLLAAAKSGVGIAYADCWQLITPYFTINIQPKITWNDTWNNRFMFQIHLVPLVLGELFVCRKLSKIWPKMVTNMKCTNKWMWQEAEGP